MGFHVTVATNLPPITKVMLTCFLSNKRALGFYKRHGFETDDISPGPRKFRSGKVVMPDYVIMSKPVVRSTPVSKEDMRSEGNLSQEKLPDNKSSQDKTFDGKPSEEKRSEEESSENKPCEDKPSGNKRLKTDDISDENPLEDKESIIRSRETRTRAIPRRETIGDGCV